METWFSTTKPVIATPAMVKATPYLSVPVTSQRAISCVMCSALGRSYPSFSPPAPTISPPNSNWSDTEEQEDWDGERQKEKEHREKGPKEKELEVKSKNNTEEEYYPPRPLYRPYSPFSKNKDTLVPIPTNTLVPAPEKKSKEGEQKMEVVTKDKSDMNSETDSNMDNTMGILRAELI